MYWDGTGMVLVAKTLEQGGFHWPRVQDGVMRLTAPQLSALLDGAGLGPRVYAVETEIRGQSADARRAARQDRSRPVIEALEPWLRARLETISQKGKLAEAIRYALSRWEGLARFLDDGRIELDSTPSSEPSGPSP